MRTVRVDTGKPYDICIERGILDKCGEYAKALSKAEKVTIISDSNVAPLYMDRVKNSLEKEGFKVATHIFKAGEEQKHLGSIAEMYNTLAEFSMTRKDIVVALGGGVVGDMAALPLQAICVELISFRFLPLSFHRLIHLQAENRRCLPQGKNLVGAFHQPIAVLIDPDTLKTLTDDYICDGMGEVIKYGCIKDEKLFENLENQNALEHIEDIIEICVSIKRDVVNRDEKEAGERKLLNFGHTLGHAIEKIYNFKGISHGMAVAIGMVLITKAGEKHGITEKGTADKICALCKKYGLPTTDKSTFEQMHRLQKAIKRQQAAQLTLYF